jgi:hypothetical protein
MSNRERPRRYPGPLDLDRPPVDEEERQASGRDEAGSRRPDEPQIEDEEAEDDEDEADGLGPRP